MGPRTGPFVISGCDSVDRCAVLVDAGYLLAEGGKAYCGVRGRARVECDYTGVASALARQCGALVNLPVLRTYWYDAARDGIPTGDHLTVASAPRVKLRLGRLSGGRQKGVDSLIVHDLITLAHARAVCTMYLLGGDEDLREGVAAAQRLGVQVIVLGIDGRAQSSPHADPRSRRAHPAPARPLEGILSRAQPGPHRWPGAGVGGRRRPRCRGDVRISLGTGSWRWADPRVAGAGAGDPPGARCSAPSASGGRVGIQPAGSNHTAPRPAKRLLGSVAAEPATA